MKCNRVLCCFFLMVSALINNVAVADVRVDVAGDDFGASPELREDSDSFFKTSNRTRLLLDKIKNLGGVSNDLRTESCEALKVNSPFYFDKYSALVDVLYELAE